MSESSDIRTGVIDVHAHWLPRDLLGLPPGNPYGGMNDRDGELFLGDIPLSFATAATEWEHPCGWGSRGPCEARAQCTRAGSQSRTGTPQSG